MSKIDETNSPDVFRILLSAAAVVIVVAGVKAAATIVIPFLLALFLAILAGPPLAWLTQRGLSRGLATAVIIALIVIFGFLAVAVLGNMANRLATEWSTVYQPRAVELTEAWNRRITLRSEDLPWLAMLQIERTNLLSSSWLNAEVALGYFASAMISLTSTLSNLFFILLTTLFVLAEAVALPTKLRAAFSNPEGSIQDIERITKNINHYMGIKTATSALTGIIVTVSLLILDVNFALLWGALAFFLNFVPNIGSILAAVPAVLLALIEGGLGTASLAAILYLAINMIIGNILEPRWMGRGLGLSTLCVFLSLVFWGWLLGPVGMVISVPLTMALKITLESNPSTRWIGVMMGDASNLEISKAE